MALSIQPYKGTRDFYPEDMRLRKWMFDKWREVCESFGYEEYDGPVLEPLELFTAKTSEEIVDDQSYSFTDRGERKVIMRPEMTPTVSRMVAARRQELAYPARLYSIANFFRYERPQKGRLREFWQLNADIFGIEGVEADVEIIQLADALMKSFGSKEGSYEIRLNSRVLLDNKINAAEPKVEIDKIIRLIDGFEKMDELEFKAKLTEAVNKPNDLYQFLMDDRETEATKEIIEKCASLGVKVIPKNSLARGFDYYTDIVFEVFDTNDENNRSLFGGGRYDGLVGLFGVEPVPTVGFGMGDVTLQNFLQTNNLIPELKNTTDLVLATVGDVFTEANKLASGLREKGLNVSLDASDRKLDKKIKAADKQGVKYVLFVGEAELKVQKFNLKNLQTGIENQVPLSKINKTLLA
ncbi:histidine--tRNA ligase [Candidatus Parcubacteria bacterium]|nr:histidine--tRNA ligase [Candidatus Parcubacteria bacterium]